MVPEGPGERRLLTVSLTLGAFWSVFPKPRLATARTCEDGSGGRARPRETIGYKQVVLLKSTKSDANQQAIS
jgi:hypothetical protein